MSLSDSQVWTLASHYARRHGAESLARARDLASALKAAGDAEGHASWLLVMRAIEAAQGNDALDCGAVA